MHNKPINIYQCKSTEHLFYVPRELDLQFYSQSLATLLRTGLLRPPRPLTLPSPALTLIWAVLTSCQINKALQSLTQASGMLAPLPYLGADRKWNEYFPY